MRIGLKLILSCVVAAAPFAALPAQQGSPAPQYHQLKHKPQPELGPGSIGALEGRVNAEGERIVVDRLSVMQPVIVAVLAQDASRPLEVEIVKGAWSEVAETLRTDAKGIASAQFRTQESFGMRVRALRGDDAAYSLLVWVGDEFAPTPASIFPAARRASAAAAEARRPGSESSAASGRMGVVTIGVIAVALIAAGLWFLSRRRASRGE